MTWALTINSRIKAELVTHGVLTADLAWSTDFVSTLEWRLSSKGRAHPSQTEDATNGGSGDGFEGRSPGGRGRQTFGQVIESSCVHVYSFFRQRRALPRISSTRESMRYRVTFTRNQLATRTHIVR